MRSLGVSRDHPRSRGEYFAEACRDLLHEGSSPLSRGIPCHVITAVAANGIIPALAGNTFLEVLDPGGQGDHPRSRGEYPTDGNGCPSLYGSSPLSRGILSPDTHVGPGPRIIPALAGNTTGWPSATKACGGSSPLSRGIQWCMARFEWEGRIIPALAGNTGFPVRRRVVFTDHPRSRGEYSPRSTGRGCPGGSSPLSRGILAER